MFMPCKTSKQTRLTGVVRLYTDSPLNMRNIIIILFCISFCSAFSQHLTRLTIVVPDSYDFYSGEKYSGDSIVFNLDNDGNLSTSEYYRNDNKENLKSAITINKNEVQTFNDWNINQKSNFNTVDLEIDSNSLNLKIRKTINNKLLHFEVPELRTVNLDSFELCQKYRQRDSKSPHDGKPTLVEIEYDNGNKETLVLRNQLEHLLDFRKYIYCYFLLKNKIPEKLQSSSEFSNQGFEYRLINYFIITECEGYYKDEYYSNKPNSTAQDKRMEVGWDFKEYLKSRNQN